MNELQATPVTLGIVLALCGLVSTMLLYVYHQASEGLDGVHRVELLVKGTDAKLEAIEESVRQAREVFEVQLDKLHAELGPASDDAPPKPHE